MSNITDFADHAGGTGRSGNTSDNNQWNGAAYHAAARVSACAPIAKALAMRAADRVANDNGAGAQTRSASDQMIHAALRHFAAHGIGAAREARAQAEKAFFAGDRQAYDWWIGITRTLDRRLAAEAVKAGLVDPR